MSKIINGKQIASEINQITKSAISSFEVKPLLIGVAVLSGTYADEDSLKYLRIKQKTAEELGFECQVERIDAKLGKKAIRQHIRQLIKDSRTAGVIVQLPLPFSANDQQYILNAVPAKFDPDCLGQEYLGKFFTGRADILPPCVEALKIVLNKEQVNLKGLSAVVVGYGKLVGKPISHWLNSMGATVTVINEFTINPAIISNSNGDLIVSGVGIPNLIQRQWVSDDAVIVDFGYGRNANGEVSGDVDFDAVKDIASVITPVPNGMGPIVIATLLHNAMTLLARRLVI